MRFIKAHLSSIFKFTGHCYIYWTVGERKETTGLDFRLSNCIYQPIY